MKNGDYYNLDNIAFRFYNNNFDLDLLTTDMTESGFKILQTKWDKIYKKYMDKIRPYIKDHQQELLDKVNDKLRADIWSKYCLGKISKWEMDSIGCYIHEHELYGINMSEYGLVDFEDLDPKSDIERFIPIKGKMIPIFRLSRICGTVLDKNKMKKTIVLLTTEGVINVKIYGAFEQYDKQISERGADGKKHVIEKSIFTRGNKLIITGIRQDDDFIAKVYKNTPWHRVEQIIGVGNDGSIVIKAERAETA
jgi:DNA polymerase-3 subunit alpha